MALFRKFVQRRHAEERASSLAFLLLLISASIFDLPCFLKEMFIFENNRESVSLASQAVHGSWKCKYPLCSWSWGKNAHGAGFRVGALHGIWMDSF